MAGMLGWHVRWYPEMRRDVPEGISPRLAPGWTIHADAPKRQMRHWDLTAWPRVTDAILHHAGTLIYRMRLDGVIARDRCGMLCASDLTVIAMIDARIHLYAFICDLAEYVLDTRLTLAAPETRAVWHDVIACKRQLLRGELSEDAFYSSYQRRVKPLPWDPNFGVWPYSRIFAGVSWPRITHEMDYIRSAIEAPQFAARPRWNANGAKTGEDTTLQEWAENQLAARLCAAMEAGIG